MAKRIAARVAGAGREYLAEYGCRTASSGAAWFNTVLRSPRFRHKFRQFAVPNPLRRDMRSTTLIRPVRQSRSTEISPRRGQLLEPNYLVTIRSLCCACPAMRVPLPGERRCGSRLDRPSSTPREGDSAKVDHAVPPPAMCLCAGLRRGHPRDPAGRQAAPTWC